jgi:hypothetical protein
LERARTCQVLSVHQKQLARRLFDRGVTLQLLAPSFTPGKFNYSLHLLTAA